MFQTLADIYLEPSFKKKMDETINEYQRKDSHKLNKNNCKENKLSKCC